MKHLIHRAMILALTPLLFLVTAATTATAAPLVDSAWLADKLGVAKSAFACLPGSQRTPLRSGWLPYAHAMPAATPC